MMPSSSRIRSSTHPPFTTTATMMFLYVIIQVDSKKCVYFGHSGLRVFLPALFIKFEEEDERDFVGFGETNVWLYEVCPYSSTCLLQDEEKAEIDKHVQKCEDRNRAFTRRQILYRRAVHNKSVGTKSFIIVHK